MKNKRSHQRYLLSLLLVTLALMGWLVLPDRFPVSPGRSAAAATAMTFTVTRAGDGGVLCPPGEPTCTLRFAINAANSNPGLDTIRFQITGSAPVKTINLESELPAITDPVIIDGTTQPAYAGRPLIELNGANAGLGAIGLSITVGNSTVKGLAINRFAADGIRLSVNGGNTIQGNYIGTDAAGNADLGNGLVGVRVLSSNNLIGGGIPELRNVISGNASTGVVISVNATGNRVRGNYIGTNAAGTARLGNVVGVLISGGARDNMIGGATMGSSNVISGNSGNGIVINDSTSIGNTVQGNFIGTDPSGNVALANGLSGVVIHHTTGTIVGGADESERNVISGNTGSGIDISLGATTNQVRGNFIGTKANGTDPLGNGSFGVELGIGGGNNTFIALNTIAFNGADGVFVAIGTGNTIRENSIFSNNGLGIDLSPDGVAGNDPGDGDAGGNNAQNSPVLTSVSYSGGTLTLRGTRDFLPGSYLLEFFASSACDSSGFGEGQRFLLSSGFLNFGGTGPFEVVSSSPIPPGRFITATATRMDGANDTSEFSPCIQLVTPGSLQFSAASYSVDENGGNASVTINRVGGSDGPASVVFATSNGTATAGQDYANTNGPVGFPDGQTSVTVSVPIIDDNLSESGETINLTLSNPTGGAALGTPITAAITINDNDLGSVVHFSASNYNQEENCRPAIVTVQRLGDTSSVSTVDYTTTSGTASDRADFTAATGTLRFGPGEVSKSFVILVTEDGFTEGTETASITLSNASGASLGAPSIAMLSILDDSPEQPGNSIDDSVRFVCQHYHDFLNRQPDNGGNDFWTNEIESCGTDAHCREIKRINVSAAFFLSIEFQQTGYLVYRMYKAAYGNMPGTPVPLRLQEFLPDTQAIGQGVQVGIGDWQTVLENNKNAFAAQFVGRSRFVSAFPPGMTPAQFVDALNANSGGALSTSERNQLVNELASGAKTRAQVVRAVAEDQTLAQAEFNKAFVLMQYFGYLRRNPDNVPDADFSGYNFWLQKLNAFGGNFADAEMVKSFLVAGEYRQRFGT